MAVFRGSRAASKRKRPRQKPTLSSTTQQAASWWTRHGGDSLRPKGRRAPPWTPATITKRGAPVGVHCVPIAMPASKKPPKRRASLHEQALLKAHRAAEDPVELGHGRGVRRRRRRARARRAAWAGADRHAAGSGILISDVQLGVVHRIAPGVRRWTALKSGHVDCPVWSALAPDHESQASRQWQTKNDFFKFHRRCCETWTKESYMCVSFSRSVSRHRPRIRNMRVRLSVVWPVWRGCGSLAQAQASARVDVPTAILPFSVVWTKESNTCVQVFWKNGICARRTTDRDLDNQRHEKFNTWLVVCTTDNPPWSCQCHSR